MIIRPETPEEFEDLYHLIETAFKTTEVSDGTEQDFTNRLRAGDNYIPDLALVAEEKGRLIDQVIFTRLHITGGARKNNVHLLAPISVVQEYRRRGVGSVLIREGFARAKDLSYQAVVLVGNPLYYAGSVSPILQGSVSAILKIFRPCTSLAVSLGARSTCRYQWTGRVSRIGAPDDYRTWRRPGYYGIHLLDMRHHFPWDWPLGISQQKTYALLGRINRFSNGDF